MRQLQLVHLRKDMKGGQKTITKPKAHYQQLRIDPYADQSMDPPSAPFLDLYTDPCIWGPPWFPLWIPTRIPILIPLWTHRLITIWILCDSLNGTLRCGCTYGSVY